MSLDINFMVGGEAGQGVQSVGFMLAKAFARGGYHVFADQDYESRVRGGHNFYRVRVKDTGVAAIAEPVDMLIALNKESMELHQDELAQKGVIIFDGEVIKDADDKGSLFSVPLERLAESSTGNKLMANTVALGAALGLVQYHADILDCVLRDQFGAGQTAEENIKATRAGYEYAQANYKGDFSHSMKQQGSKRMLLNGNEAIALGAMAAGCKLVAAYPMTPASSIMEFMATKARDFGLVVVQPEDEIAAVHMIIGASYAGVRAMTATSGGGFCLMVEGLGLAGMTETPIVMVDAQRPGPAIGLPTRTEQGDLQFVLHAHHGDFPRAVLAPATPEDAFWLTVKAFNMADKYQLPAILLTDQHLASSYFTIDSFNLSRVTVDRGLSYSASEAGTYQRHRVTESGISPRAFPGHPGILVVTDSDEHDEAGHLIEDSRIRNEQMQKRLRKLSGLRNDISPPQLYGPKVAETTLIGWGSTYGAIHEAVDILNQEGATVNSINFTELWPFPSGAVARLLDGSRYSYVIESNATGQLSRLIRSETGIKVSGEILKYDGRPFTPAHIAREIRKESR